MKKIAIIGCNSFLARNFVEAYGNENFFYLYGRTLHHNYDALVNYKYIEFNYPSNKLNLDDFLNYDVIIYAAAGGVQANLQESNLLTYQINTFFPIDLVTHLEYNNFKGKIITFGSYFEIGNNNKFSPFDEESLVFASGSIPNSYCDSKRLLTRFYSNKQFNVTWYHLILPSLYGPGEDENRLIPYLINSLKEKKKPRLSSGEQIRQYIYISDLVNLMSLLIDQDIKADLYNVAGLDLPLSIKALVARIFDMLEIERPENQPIATRDQQMLYLALDDFKIRTAVKDWAPVVDLNTGLRKYL
ncbi:NAD-dependent epimerase/dehydratase family protein [Pedobacter roseus]|uniref:NAD(P)-dependent oxidoreductase n=1 Tax=Pedobacter roseus TaxID=336820 RepID=A0A7G9QDN4_9SPHI|nr:NAD(P)-dependent oxidoreductase [Pedobacter roseus]QNN41459.1 NAD(P)-dependent oxidoreductase [Pedobacter roseus]